MLRSMTGFGAGTVENDDYRVQCEVRSVNQRYLEPTFHMGKQLFPWENEMRKILKEYLSRGKVDLFITYLDKREHDVVVHVNHGLARAYHEALNEISDTLRLARPDDVATIAAYPDVLQLEDNSSLADMKPLLLQALREALQALVSMREREGANIAQDFIQRLTTLQADTEKLKALAPEIVTAYRERLQKSLAEVLAEEDIDQTRLIQEVAIYSDHVNYTEEVVRLGSHFEQFRSLLEGTEPVGRRLDFLIQEMNREVNTIGSKANSTTAAQLVVDMKSEIEKLREQIQNIE